MTKLGEVETVARVGSRDHVVKSVARTLEILELFDEIRQPVNVVTVSEALNYPQSSTSALLRSLVTMGYLQFDARARTYFPTDRVPLLGSWVCPPLFEQADLPRLARSIRERLGQLVLVAARNGDQAQYIHVLNGPSEVGHHIRNGAKRPLATSGVGLALLAAMPDAEVRRLYHRLNAYAKNRDAVVQVPELLAQLAAIRQDGYAFSTHRVVEGFGMIGIALPAGCTTRPLVIGVGGRADVLEPRRDEIVTAVREEVEARFGRYVAGREREVVTREDMFCEMLATVPTAASWSNRLHHRAA